MIDIPGPIPNRSEDLARDRSRKGREIVPVTRGTMREVAVPDADPNWHPIAKMLWDGCLSSGQFEYYQNSDLAMLYSLCEDLSEYKNPKVSTDGVLYFKRSGQMLQTIYSAMSNLLVTEGDRRRVRIELTAPEPEKKLASVSAIEDARRALGVAE